MEEQQEVQQEVMKKRQQRRKTDPDLHTLLQQVKPDLQESLKNLKPERRSELDILVDTFFDDIYECKRRGVSWKQIVDAIKASTKRKVDPKSLASVFSRKCKGKNRAPLRERRKPGEDGDDNEQEKIE